MSFTTEQVRAQLAAMGYHNVPDAAVTLFAARLTEKAKHQQQHSNDDADEKADITSHFEDSSGRDDETIDDNASQHHHSSSVASHRVHSSIYPRLSASRPPLPPSNRAVLMQRTPLTSLHDTTASPHQPRRTAHNQSPAHKAQHSLRAEEEQCEDEYEYTTAVTAADGGGRSEKENVATLINIQRGLAKVLAERGIASPFKPASTTTSATTLGASPASSYSTSISRPLSPFSTSDLSDSTMSSSVSIDSTAPLASARALQLRQDERVRGVRRGYGQGGFKKADVVNRYQQYKAEWEQSTFLHRRQNGK